MMAGLWENLPPDLLELVLSRLPVQSVCRFRRVCKKWNHLITQSGFASLCAQSPRPSSSILITPRQQLDRGAGLNWHLLDMTDRSFHTLNTAYATHTLASDGGLVYAMYMANKPQRVRQVVCNPVSGSFHHIPAPDYRFSYRRDIAAMTVDRASQQYRIVLMEAYNATSTARQEHVYMYDSEVKVWSKLPVPGPHLFAYSNVFLNGILYTLFVDTLVIPWSVKLWEFTGERWRCLDVELPQVLHAQDKSLLVVSLRRLFFVEFTGLPMFPFIDMTMWEDFIDLETWTTRMKKRHQVRVSISEIKGAELMKVAEITKFARYSREMLQKHPDLLGDAVVALGCGESIVVLSLLGRCAGWDLRRGCWYEMPGDTARSVSEKCRYGIHAGLLDLDLRKMKDLP